MELNLTSKHFKKGEEKLAKELRAYIQSKLSRIEQLLPAHAKKSARLDVIIDESGKKSQGFIFNCEVKLKLPEKSLVASFKANDAHGAFNKCEAKISRQIRRYKIQHHTLKKMDKKTLAKLRRVLKRG